MAHEVGDDGPAPVGGRGGRIAALDFVRGIAVMGILVANLPAMAHADPLWPGGYGAAARPGDDWLWAVQYVLVDGKMRGLFTLLFGAGLYLFIERAEARGAGPDLQARRLLVLAGFGIAHYLFLWRGDILLTYALGGLVMLAFVGMSRRTQAVLGLFAYAAGAAFYGAVAVYLLAGSRGALDAAAGQSLAAAFAQGQRSAADEAAVDTAFRQNGSWIDMVAHTVSAHPFDGISTTLFGALETLPLMLLGMAAYRFGLFAPQPSRRRLTGAAAMLALGAAANGAIAAVLVRGGLDYWEASAALAGMGALPNLAMVLGFTVVLAGLSGRAAPAIATRVEGAGRCAFTNYIGSSVVGLLLFSGWGADGFGHWTRVELLGATVLIWAGMLWWSAWWLARYRFGPLEWLWRCATYGRRFPLRRRR